MPIGCGVCEGGIIALICSGWSGWRVKVTSKRRRKEHEECVHILRSTPLFKMQLPRADIPLLAAELKRHKFPPRSVVVKEGELQEEFFLVASGKASVLIGTQEVAKMARGDWWGDCTLIRKTPSMATIRVCGDEALVAFSLTREQFERLGLHKRLRLPKRSNVVVCGRGPESPVSGGQRAEDGISEADEEFIVNAMANASALQELHHVRGDLIQAVAKKASIRTVKAGNAIVCSGEFSQEFYIVKSGDVEVIPPLARPRGKKSVQALGRLEDENALAGDYTSRWLHNRTGSFDFKRWTSEDSSLNQRVTSKNWEENDEMCPITSSVSSRSAARHTTSEEGSPKSNVWKMRRARTSLSKPMLKMHRGAVFGEDVMFYNVQHAATFRAAESRDVELYVVARQDYMLRVHGFCERYQEWCKLLDEACGLSLLFQSQRHELARHARGYQRFDRGAMVVKKGRTRRRDSSVLYVIAAGGAKALVPKGRSGALVEVPLRRGDVFAERSSETDGPEDYSIKAGDQDHPTLTCLCIDLSLLKGFGVSEADIAQIVTSLNAELGARSQQSRRALATDAHSPFRVENLVPVCPLGSGGFGFVTLHKDRNAERLYAMKRISKGIIPTNFRENICAERDLMELADSKFIIRFYSSYRDTNFLYIIQEAALGGDLNVVRPLLTDANDVAQNTVMFYVGCIIAGLEHLHDRHVVFRDLKPENALLDSAGYAKLCDMGMARFVFGKTYTFCGTPDYMAPEMLVGSGHDAAVDWWALGVMIVDLLTSAAPWQVEQDLGGQWVQALLAQQRQGFEPSKIPAVAGKSALGEFLKALLLEDPNKRLGGGGGARQVRQHMWFGEARFDFGGLHSQDERRLAPPYRPAPFQPPELPMPDFRLDTPVLVKQNQVLQGGRFVREERMTLSVAVRILEQSDELEGFYARLPKSPEEQVFVFFLQSKEEESVWLDSRPAWVAYLKDRSLFKPYQENPDQVCWDAGFTSADVCVWASEA